MINNYEKNWNGIIDYLTCSHKMCKIKTGKKYNMSGTNKMAIYKYVQKHAIKKNKCEICGKTNTNAHHEDYNQRLNVIYLCHSCHMNRHHYKMEFINNAKTISIFNKHGFDLISNVKKEIELDTKKYIKYYKDYFCKPFGTRSKIEMKKQYTKQYAEMKEKGLHMVGIYLDQKTYSDLCACAKISYSKPSLIAVKIIKEYLEKFYGFGERGKKTTSTEVV